MNFDIGYYTIDSLKTFFQRYVVLGITFYPWNRTCLLSLDNDVNLEKLGLLFGIDENRELKNGSTVITDKPIDLNGGLRYVCITCSLVDRSKDFHNGNKSEIIAALPVGDTEAIKGKVQTFDKIMSETQINKGVVNQIHFGVTDQDGNAIDVGRILLDAYIV